jgi:ribonuclease HI
MAARSGKPTCNIGVVADFGKTHGINKLIEANPSVHVLCSVGPGQLPLEAASCWHNKQHPARRLDIGLKLIVVMNQAGFAKYARRTDLAPLQDAVHTELGAELQWQPHLRSPPPRKRRPSEAFSKATEAPEPGARTRFESDTTFDAVTGDMQPRRFADPADIMYTDGSKKGSTVTGAAVLQTEEIEVAFKLRDHDGQLNTPLHGELAAIHTALTHLQLCPHRHRDVIMTDSQTALHLINMAIHRPEDMRINKHKEIVLQIAQMLAAWPRCIHLLKVRAHVDVTGNTLADQLAKDAQTDDACPVFDEAGKAGRGQHWIVYEPPQQHAGGGGDPPRPWAVNNLKGHVLSLAETARAKQVLACPTQSVLKLIKHLAEDDGGVELHSTNAFLWNQSLTPQEMRNAMLVRAHRLHTKCREARWAEGTTRQVSTVCPLCKRATDDAHHALGDDCKHGDIRQLITSRHDAAVNTFWSAIQAGALAAMPMWTDLDLRTKAQKARRVPNRRKLPDFVLQPTAQHSIPDIAVMQVDDDFQYRPAQGGPSTLGQWCRAPQDHPWDEYPEDRQKVTLHLIEVKYTYDLKVHALVAKAQAQHQDLQTQLLAKGWGQVKLHPIIIGAAGLMRQGTDSALDALGVCKDERKKLLTKLSLENIRSTSSMMKLRRPYLSSAEDPAAQQGGPGPGDQRPPRPPRGGDGAPQRATRWQPGGHQPGDPAEHNIVMTSTTGRQIRLTQLLSTSYCKDRWTMPPPPLHGAYSARGSNERRTLPFDPSAKQPAQQDTMTALHQGMRKHPSCWGRSSAHHLSKCTRVHTHAHLQS